MREKNKLQGLYVISDDIFTPKGTLIAQVEEALKGGARVVQLRDKKNNLDSIKNMAFELEKLCKKYNAVFILNDKVELAIELGLSGLHIGKSDHHRVEEIRKNFAGYLGVSCYGDVAFGKKMQDIGVDYVAFGSFFASPTKPHSNVVDLEVLKKAKQELNIPICAIGGLNSDNIADIMQHKPDMIALISDIWKSENIQNRAQFFASLYEEQR